MTTIGSNRPHRPVGPVDPAVGDPTTDVETQRIERLRLALAEAEVDAGLFYDPINIRYATGTSNMQVYSLHNPCRYVFVATDGPVVLHEFKGCEHLSDGHPAVDQVRTATGWYHFTNGPRTAEFAKRWAAEIHQLLVEHGRGDMRLAVDRLDPPGADALRSLQVEIVDGQRVANQAKHIKSPAEIELIRHAVMTCEAGLDKMRAALRPGLTENELWSELHRHNIATGGEWLETRLLTSGPRTNPWYQECSSKQIEAGELVAFDTDLIGVGGYSVDISRTWIAGEVRPSAEQQRLWHAAATQLAHNIELLQPGASFLDVTRRSHRPNPAIHSLTNAAVAHGIGLCNEYPLILNRDHIEDCYDGQIEPGMVLCAEALAAPPGGRQSVKLEQQLLITETGPELLSTHPLDL